MSIFDKPAAEEPQEYKFITSDINDFMNEFNEPKQEMPDAVNFDNFPTYNSEADNAPEMETLKANAGVAKSTAKIIVATIDGFIPEIMRAVAKAPDSEPFKADTDTKKELENAFAEYIKLKGVGDIPPGVLIIILLLTAYGSKIPMIMQLRKANIKAEEDKQQIESLQAEIQRLKESVKDGKSS